MESLCAPLNPSEGKNMTDADAAVTLLADRFNSLLTKFSALQADNIQLKAKIEALESTKFSALQADNIQLKARIEALESTTNIKYGVNEPVKQSFLSEHLIHVYTEDQIPYTLVGIWSTIFDFLPLTDYEQWRLRMQCKLFRDAIKQGPLVTPFPSKKYNKIEKLLKKIKKARQRDKPFPTLILFARGDHEVTVRLNEKNKKRNYLLVDLPLTFVGYSADTTRIVGGLEIKGQFESLLPFQCVDLTVTGSIGSGIWNTGGLPMNFLRCNFSHNKVMGIDTYLNSTWSATYCNVLNNSSTGVGAKGK
jgi:hypothetical protein